MGIQTNYRRLALITLLATGLIDSATGLQGHDPLDPKVATMGQRLDVLGDLNGDGTPELRIGAWTSPTADFVVSGADGSLLHTEPYGKRIADINHDGVTDVLARSTIRSGVDGRELRVDLEEHHPDMWTKNGLMGDLDGDGSGDYVTQIKDTLFFISGISGLTLKEFSLGHNEEQWLFANTEKRTLYLRQVMHDVDQDGWPDLLLGSLYHHNRMALVSSKTGRALIHLERRYDKLWIRTGSNLRSFPQPNVPTFFSGTHVNLFGIGDINSDGVEDLMFSAHASDADRTGSNGVWIEALCGQTLQKLWRNEYFWAGSVQLVPDLDQDGQKEILVGTPEYMYVDSSMQILSSADGTAIQHYSNGDKLIGSCMTHITHHSSEQWLITGGSFFQGGHSNSMSGYVTAFKPDGSIAWTRSGFDLESTWRRSQGIKPRKKWR